MGLVTDAELSPQDESREKCDEIRDKIRPRLGLVQMNGLRVVKETRDGHDDDSPKSGLWQVVKERREKRENDENKKA